jgi:saccharopepsin
MVVMDTGSGNLLLPSSDCQDEPCTSHKRFDSKLSATSMEIAFADQPLTKVNGTDGERDVVTITFGTGEMSGVYIRDNVCLGNNICCKADFVAATDESDEPFSLVPFDGILGLSLPQMAEGNAFSIIDQMVNANVLEQPLFGVFFGNDDEESEITFGSYKRERMTGELFWTPVTEPGYWQVKVEDIKLGDKKQQICTGTRRCQVAVDTGTSLLAAPPDVVDELVDHLQVAQDCSNIDSLPDMGFIIGDHVLNLKAEDYVAQTVNGCSLGLMALDIPPPKGPLFIFGDPFLRKFYTVYDRKNLRVGFAFARHQKEEPSLLALRATHLRAKQLRAKNLRATRRHE